jgi:hypothetical protein
MSKIREIFGRVLLIIAMLSYLIGGIYTVFICWRIVRVVFGPIVSYLSLMIFPMLLIVAPWYALFAWGNWRFLVIVYGVWIMSSILLALSKWLLKEEI